MIQCDLISEVITDGAGTPTGLRVGKKVYDLFSPGGVRLKCRIDDMIIKFDGGGSQGQTYKEALLATKLQIVDTKYFVEVIHAGEAKTKVGAVWNWLAQPWISVCATIPKIADEALKKKCQQKVNQLCETYYLDDIGSYGHNWTILGENPLIYDYGFGRTGDRTWKKT